MANIVSQFTSSVRTGVAPLTVNFTNTSTGPYNSVRWDFGDNSNSSLINPSHQYTSNGVFQVTLTVYGENGEESSSQSSVTVFADDDYSITSTTQQALFTSKRFSTGQVSVRKTLVDGSTIETEAPLSSATEFNLSLNGVQSMITDITVTGSSTANRFDLNGSQAIITAISNLDDDSHANLVVFLNTGVTFGSDCIGSQYLVYEIVDAADPRDYILVDRPIPNIDTGGLGFPAAIFFSSANTQYNAYHPNSNHKSIQSAPTIDGLETLNLPDMYAPNSTASGLLKYFYTDDQDGSTKLFVLPSYSGWNSVEKWKEGSVRLDLPYNLWHGKGEAGVSLIDSTVTYRDDKTNLSYTNLSVDGTTDIVGKVYHEKKLLVIEDIELQNSLRYLSNRSFTLPEPVVGITSTADVGGIESGVTYFVTYRVSDGFGEQYNSGTYFGNEQSVHCGYIKEITPNVSDKELRVQIPQPSFYTSDRGLTNDSGFTAQFAYFYIGSATTGNIEDADWKYAPVSTSFSSTFDGVSLAYTDFSADASMTELSFSGNGGFTFGDETTLFGYFSATTQSTIYKMAATCVAKNNEFNATQNETFDSNGNESVWISEVAIYNENNELLMTGKLNTPIEKNDSKFVTIKLELDL